MGAFPIPLDWDRPWQVWLLHCLPSSALAHAHFDPQKWPVTPVVGALVGHAFGSIVGFALVAWRKALEVAVDVLEEAKQNKGLQLKAGGAKETRKSK